MSRWLHVVSPWLPHALIALAVSLAPGCGGNTLEPRRPESEMLKDARCGGKKSRTEPLVVEWSDPARGRLESDLRNGLVVVAFEGCEVRILRQCKAYAYYQYRALTRKNTAEHISNTDELYLRLPVGAAGLESDLKRWGELSVAMTIVGRWDTDVRALRREDLQGSECSGATHIIAGASVGAFDFVAGTKGTAHAEAAGLGAKAGGSTESAHRTINTDGDAEACTAAKLDDRGPPNQCGALIGIELVALDALGTGASIYDDVPRDAAPPPPGMPVPDGGPPPPEPAPAPRASHAEPTFESVFADSVIQFEPGKADFVGQSAAVKLQNELILSMVKMWLVRHPDLTELRIEGHTDNSDHRGSAALSEKRALVVKQFLEQNGVDPRRLVAVGVGQSYPIADNASPEGRAKNNRVSFHIARATTEP